MMDGIDLAHMRGETMAKASKGTTTTVQDEARKQRKKQAKQEAKLMLKVEQARKDVQKAQKKLTKAQANLEASNAQVQMLENKLTQLRSSQQDEQSSSGQWEGQPDESETLTVFTSEGAVPFIELPMMQTEMGSAASGEQAGSASQEWRPSEPTSNGSSAETEDKSVPSSEQEAESSDSGGETTRGRRHHQRATQNEENQ